MRYFVIAPDGSKYGPADLPTLRAWVAEGRIVADTMLEEEKSRQRVAARMVAGLFSTESMSGLPPVGAHVPRAERSKPGDNGNSDLLWSYVCSAMTIVCCCFFNIGGWVYANKAIAKGNPGGKTARIVAGIFLVLWIITTILTIPFLGQLKDMAMKMINQDQAGISGQ